MAKERIIFVEELWEDDGLYLVKINGKRIQFTHRLVPYDGSKLKPYAKASEAKSA